MDYINKIFNMDCLSGMSMYPDKSLDMILCDLPYGMTGCRWDSLIPFSEALVPVLQNHKGQRRNCADGLSTVHDRLAVRLRLPKLHRLEQIRQRRLRQIRHCPTMKKQNRHNLSPAGLLADGGFFVALRLSTP